MAVLIKAGVSKRGKPSIIDKNNYSYVGNGGTETTIHWRCSRRPCTMYIENYYELSCVFYHSMQTNMMWYYVMRI